MTNLERRRIQSIHNVFDLAEYVVTFFHGIIRALIAPIYVKDTPTVLKLSHHDKLAMRKRVAVSEIFPFQLLLDIKSLADCTINEVWVAILSGGFRRYLLKHDLNFQKTRKARIHGG